MSEEFQLFISSTVNDLTTVRKDLAKKLHEPGRIIRCSEDMSFPVEPGLTSYDACLAVVRRCHGFALLIGTRFGGEYLSHGKSITWREWEEACLTGLTPIVLVNRKTNELCRVIAKERSILQKARPAANVTELDEALEKKLKNKLAGYHRAPALQRFVDTVRKGHTDNWVKLDWDGTAREAVEYIQFNLAVQAAAAERRRRDAVELLQAVGQTLADQRNYVSILAKPYYRADGKPGGAVTLSSSRVDHFTKADGSAAQAFDTVVSFINMVMLEV